MIEAALYNQCVRCGLCLPTCPTYIETLTETSGPRGRISLIRDVAEGRLDVLSPGFVHQMSECLDCRACAAVCPSGVQYGTLVESARARIERAAAPKRGFFSRFGRWFTLKALFGNLELMRFCATLLRFYQRSGLQRLVRATGLLRLFRLSETEAFAPPISKRYFIPDDQVFEAAGARLKVMLHAGCVMQVAFAHVHDATVRVLTANRCTVVVPAEQGCCGALSMHAGREHEGLDFARGLIASFAGESLDAILVNAAGCGSNLKDYGRLLAGDPLWADRAACFAAKVRDVSEFMSELPPVATRHPIPVTVAYHDACHLANAQGIRAQPRAMLRSIPELRLVEIREGDSCCGSAGIYNLVQPDSADEIGARKAADVLAAGAELLASANPGCVLQIQKMLRARGAMLPAAHPIEILDASIAGRGRADVLAGGGPS